MAELTKPQQDLERAVVTYLDRVGVAISHREVSKVSGFLLLKVRSLTLYIYDDGEAQIQNGSFTDIRLEHPDFKNQEELTKTYIGRLEEALALKFRSNLAKALRDDAEEHKRGNFNQLGRDFETLDANHPRYFDRTLSIAWNFWDAWLDERNHDFAEFYKISRNQWPELALELAKHLERGEEISNSFVWARFEPKPPSPIAKVVPFFVIAGFLLLMGSCVGACWLLVK